MTSSALLQPVAKGLWRAWGPMKAAGLDLGTFMTVVGLDDGGLLLHSPARLTDPLREELEALGRVVAVVAPSKVHHLFVSDYLQAFPDAKLFGAPGLQAKRKDLPFDAELGSEKPTGFPEELDYVRYDGSDWMSEIMFFHRSTRTLLLTDLAFNIRESSSWWTRRYLKWSNAYGQFGQSKFVKLSTRNRAAGRASVDRVLELDFDRVTVTHGDVLERGGKDALRSAFSWL